MNANQINSPRPPRNRMLVVTDEMMAAELARQKAKNKPRNKGEPQMREIWPE